MREEAALFRSNVDYGGAPTTWGCHESYLHTSDPRSLPQSLNPHLVSRIIYCGAGGFDATSPGLDFLLSPRVPFLYHVTSAESII